MALTPNEKALFGHDALTQATVSGNMHSIEENLSKEMLGAAKKMPTGKVHPIFTAFGSKEMF
jgi:hypothetical protein